MTDRTRKPKVRHSGNILELLQFATRNPSGIFSALMELLRMANSERHSGKISLLKNYLIGDVNEYVHSLTGLYPNEDEVEEIKKIYHEAKATVAQEYRNAGISRDSSIISISDAVAIYSIVRACRPKRIVETGVSDGMSSLVILLGLKRNGTGSLISIDYPKVGMPSLIQKLPGWIVPADLKLGWTLMYGKSRNVLPKVVDQIQNINLFLHDSEHSYSNMLFEFKTVLPHMTSKGLIISDDGVSNDSILDFCQYSEIPLENIAISQDGFAGIKVNRTKPYL